MINRFLLIAAAALTANVAQAQTLPLAPRTPVSVAQVRVTPMTTVQANYVRVIRPGEDNIAQTSLARALSSRRDATGEAGFICGLMPHPDTSGAAAAFGHDPHGRFVGAKLRVAF